MPYTKSIKDVESLFEIEPEKIPSFFQASFLLLLAPVLILWMVDFKLGITSAIAVCAWMFFNWHNNNATNNRIKLTFKVSGEGLTINNHFYSKESIHRIKIRNQLDKDYAMAIHNYAMPHALLPGTGLRDKLRNVSFRVDMEANGIAVVIAGGITEATAYAIVSDVNRIFEW